MRMGVRVIHDLMSRVMQCLDRITAAVYPFPHYEEGRGHVVFAENSDQLFGVFIPPGRVKGR